MMEKIFQILGILTFLLIDYVIIRYYFSDKKSIKNIIPIFNRPYKKSFNFQWLLIIIFSIFIVFTPLIFTSSLIGKQFNFTQTGNIGDTINGIAGPFIAWLGAILVFVTFREQVKANKSIKSQNDFNLVLQNLNSLQADYFNIKQLCTNASTQLTNHNYNSPDLKRVIEIVRDFQSMIILIDTINENDKMLKSKILLIWDSIYKPAINPLNQQIVNIGMIGGFAIMIGNLLTFNQDYVFVDRKISEYQ